MRNLRPRFESDTWDQIERLHAASFSWALTCCRFDEVEAADVLQTAYLKILDGRARYEGRSALRTWLFSVIRRTAADRHRRKLREVLALERWFGNRAPESRPGVEELLTQAERRSYILSALRGLAARQRQVLDLVFYQGITIEEAAEVMGVSVGTARAHYDRGKRRLLRELSGLTGP
jgi:RNA polymerase sigma-70 factor (ECF subfamily)